MTQLSNLSWLKATDTEGCWELKLSDLSDLSQFVCVCVLYDNFMSTVVYLCCCVMILCCGLVNVGLLRVCCVYLSGGHSSSDLSVDLTLAKGFVETLVGRHGNSQNRAVGMTELSAVGQLMEYCVLIGQTGKRT